jgi:galactofuranosylgalactofuranosylrhamnosyl-N-acetylglucosaminyl-diphospho-decaprenol beta-1,5/1,6-galactofuranosyltransferase
MTYATFLQSIRLSKDPRYDALYSRSRNNAGERVTQRVRTEHDIFVLPCSSAVNLDAYYNSFYESYWRSHSPLQSVAASLELDGKGVARLYRVSPLRARELLCEKSFDAGRRRLRLDAPSDSLSDLEYGRLTVEILTADAPVRFYSGRWETTDTPRNGIDLCVVFCTFNKTARLIQNLENLARPLVPGSGINSVIVVDQGTQPLERDPAWPRIEEMTARDKIQVVHQGNFGGAGGFTRGIVEATRSSATHVVLMDDDILVDDDVLPRLVSFLKFASKPLTVGGAMLDLYRPLFLHAADETTDLAKLTHENRLHNTNLAKKNAADVFLKPGRGTYNGWWFCCFPIDVFRANGLPMPFFIRGDDTEFGERISAGGHTVVTLPSLFVWHEPFYAKSIVWMRYYERRNFLIIASLHAKTSPLRLLGSSYKSFLEAIAQSKYDLAAAEVMAIEDFLAGPDLIRADPRARHARLLEDLSSERPGTFTGIESRARTRRSLSKYRPIALIEILVFQLLAAPSGFFKSSEKAALVQSDCLTTDTLHGRSQPFGVRDVHSGVIVYYQANRTSARRLAWRFIKAAARLLRHGKRVGANFRATHRELTSEGFWRLYLNI